MDTLQQLMVSRATEKASAALYTLATTEGSLESRLVNAWVYEMGMLAGRQLPEEFQELYDGMYQSVTAAGPDGDKGQFETSILAMCPEEAVQLARRMVSFAIEVEKASGR